MLFLPRQDPLECKQSRVEALPRTLFSVFRKFRIFNFCSLLSISSKAFKILLSFQVSLIHALTALYFRSFKTKNSWLIFGRETEMRRLMAVLLCWDVLWTDRAQPNCLQSDQKMWNEYWCCVVYIISKSMKSGHLGKSFAKTHER